MAIIDVENGYSFTDDRDDMDDMDEGSGGSAESPVIICEYVFGAEEGSMTFSELVSALKDGKSIILRYYNMPKEYGFQFNELYLNTYFEYGYDSDKIEFSSTLMFNKTQGQYPTYSISGVRVTVPKTGSWTADTFSKTL